jgi:hypothetical protein
MSGPVPFTTRPFPSERRNHSDAIPPGRPIMGNSSNLPMAPVGRNYESPPWCYLLWGAPAAMILVSQAAYQRFDISLTFAGSIWALSVLWIGVGCLVNARSCGRVHCRIDGVAMPLLAIFGLLDAFSVIRLAWSLYWTAFFIILIASFVPELVWKKYT